MSEKISTNSYEQQKPAIEQSMINSVDNVSIEMKTVVKAIENNNVDRAIELLHNAETQLQSVRKEVEEITQRLHEAQEDALIDHLTGLSNKKAFDEALQTMVSTNLRAIYDKNIPEIFHIISFDLDGFKEINDTYGHAVGDSYLKHITAQVQHFFARGTDMLARIGGDEFSLITYDKHNVRANAENVLSAVLEGSELARQELQKEQGTLSPSDGKVSASVGYTTFDPKNDTDAKKIEARADYAVYVVKEAGKKGVLSDKEAVNNYDVNKELYKKFLAERKEN